MGLTHSDEQLRECLRRVLFKSATLRRRRAARLRVLGLTFLAMALAGSLSAAFLPTGGTTIGNPFHGQTLVSGHMLFSASNPRVVVAQGRVTFTSTSGSQSATNVTNGSFRLFLLVGRYAASGLARRPYEARCSGPVLKIGKKQKSATETLECHRNS